EAVIWQDGELTWLGNIPNGNSCDAFLSSGLSISADGSIDVSVTGGSGDFSYQWTHGPTTEDLSGLATGTYYVIVTDNVMGCVSIGGFNVQSGNEVSVSSSVTEPACGLINGAIDLTVSGGTGPYTFSWSTGASTEDISGVGPGVYSVNITDDNGCPFDTTFTLSNQSAPTVTATVTDPNCPGGNDGSIALVVSGGTGPFTYAWSNGGTTATITGLWAATYTVTVTDQTTGCTVNESYALVSPPGFNGFVDLQNETCAGAMDGFIDLTITGGTAPYSYLWNPGSITTEDLTNIGAGTYTLVFTDANGCSFNGAFSITASPAINITETHQDVSCNGENDGSIDVSVSGGTPTFTYFWEPGGEVTQDLGGLGPGTYEVFVTDAAGCSDSLEVDILEPDVLVLNASSTDASCNGVCDGTAGVTPTGGTAPYTYTWTPNVSTGATASSLCAGNYSVIVSDVNGCSDTASFTIDDNQIQMVFTSTDISCNGTCDGSATASVTGNNPPFTYDWQPSGGNDTAATNLCAGNYTLTVTDATGCEIVQPFTITEPDPIEISMAVTDVTCEGGSDGAIDLTVIGGVGPYTYQWFPMGQTTEDISNLPAGDYSILVTDANGCTSSAVTLGGAFSGGTLALPDGTGTSYTTSISVTGFQSGATLADIQDFDGICLLPTNKFCALIFLFLRISISSCLSIFISFY
ncbi:MAG: SprB repeat-containing protein, partial [Flavobacteriales bacterium]|nr:SprB repeat-containing protein [Flavobacteriales bacterium]